MNTKYFVECRCSFIIQFIIDFVIISCIFSLIFFICCLHCSDTLLLLLDLINFELLFNLIVNHHQLANQILLRLLHFDRIQLLLLVLYAVLLVELLYVADIHDKWLLLLVTAIPFGPWKCFYSDMVSYCVV